MVMIQLTPINSFNPVVVQVVASNCRRFIGQTLNQQVRHRITIRQRFSSTTSRVARNQAIATTSFQQHVPFINQCSTLFFSNERIHNNQQRRNRLFYSSTTSLNSSAKSFEETPLGKNGMHLMDGLDIYTVPAMADGHPLAVYGIHSSEPTRNNTNKPLIPILLLHGRTWSSVPVYHLLGGQKHAPSGIESRSLMEALYNKGLQPYAMDFRGFGGTPADETASVEPMKCVQDTICVLDWIAKRHNVTSQAELPALLGWSQGALIAQLVAQKVSHKYLSKLILYGSIYDPLYRYPRDPLYRTDEYIQNTTLVQNQFDAAIEDFTVEGTIPPEPARLFAEAALLSDPIKAVWKHTYQFNNVDPARVHIPCLVIAGDQDPYAPMHVQQDLFCNLGRDCDRTWSILSGCDHAVHLLDGRFRLVNILVSFLTNDKRSVPPPVEQI